MTRVLLVDDHPVVRTGLRMLLASGGIDVVAEAGNGHDGVRLAQEEDVDVVLMDLQLGAGIDGVAATEQILARENAPRVLILTTYDTDRDILRAVEAGASGYLLKDAPPGELVDAVHRAARGETVLAPVVANRLLSRLRNPAPTLSPRELDVLRQVAKGRSNREVAKKLFLSEATVKTHLVHVFDKLGVDSRTGAVTRARELGLLRD